MDIQAIIISLEELPQKIRDAGQVHLEAKNATEQAKLALQVALSEETIKSQAGNAQRQKAEAIFNTQEYHKRLLTAELNEARAENELTYLNNQFTAIRKIANLEEKQMPSNYTGF